MPQPFTKCIYLRKDTHKMVTINTIVLMLISLNIYSYSFPGLWQLCVCMGPTLWQFPWFVATLKNCHKPNPLYMAYISAGDRPPP